MHRKVAFKFGMEPLDNIMRMVTVHEVIHAPEELERELLSKGVEILVKDRKYNDALDRILKDWTDNDYTKLASLKALFEHIEISEEEDDKGGAGDFRGKDRCRLAACTGNDFVYHNEYYKLFVFY